MPGATRRESGDLVAENDRVASPMFGGLLLMAATFIAYLPCFRGQFVWDDDSWTTMLQEHFRNVGGFVDIWIHPTVLQQYYPLTGTSFWLDYQLWGFWTVPYHIENVLLHGLGAALFWRLLTRLEVPGAWLAAAIFALHPVMVESAAWITERKNVLSLVFYLGAIQAYGIFAGFWKEEIRGAKNWRVYGIALLLALGALLAKTTAFSLPPALLLICWWKRGRIRWREDMVPVLPFFALAVCMSVFTMWLEKNHVGAKGPEWDIAFLERCLIAGRALWFYAGKLVWPTDLCFVYPRWHLDSSSLAQWLFPIAAVGVLLALWFNRDRVGRGPLVAVLFFLGSLFPVLGFMNAYFMRYSFVCDHWVYLSSLGLIALGAAMIARMTERFRIPSLLPGLAIVVLPMLALLTWRQCAMYADVETLYLTTLARNPEANLARNNLGQLYLILNRVDDAIPLFKDAIARDPREPIYHNNLGFALLQKGQLDEAIAELRKAVELKPDYATAHFVLGDALTRQDKLDEAAVHFHRAIEIRPDYGEAWVNLGTIALQQGRTDEAFGDFQKAVEIQPNNDKAQNNLGEMLLRRGHPEAAFEHFRKAVDLNPNQPISLNSLAAIYLGTGRVEAAIPLLERSVQLDPNNAATHASLGVAYFRKANAAGAIEQLQKAVDLQPGNVDTCNNLAWVLATCPDATFRNGTRALELAQHAVELSGGTNVSILATLAAAYGESGSFSNAIATAKDAIELASAQTNTVLIESLRQQLALYQKGSPLRARTVTNSPATPR